MENQMDTRNISVSLIGIVTMLNSILDEINDPHIIEIILKERDKSPESNG